MRMFKVTVDGISHHEQAGARTPEEYQHYLTHTEGMKFVRVKEWISGGARQPLPKFEDEE